MELRDYLEIGKTKAGTLTALSKEIGITQPEISKAYAHKRHLQAEACIRLADYIGADRIAVIAAAELATEKKEEKRQFWRPFVENAKAAGILLALATVTNFMTPTPAQAAPLQGDAAQTICIMLNYLGIGI